MYSFYRALKVSQSVLPSNARRTCLMHTLECIILLNKNTYKYCVLALSTPFFIMFCLLMAVKKDKIEISYLILAITIV
jgi:hypothetical protein